MTFVLLAFFQKSGKSLNVAQAFTSLSVISLLAVPLQNLLGSLPAFAASMACFGRIEAYLNSAEKKDTRQTSRALGIASSSVQATKVPLGQTQGIILQDMSSRRPNTLVLSSGQLSVISISNACFGLTQSGDPILSNVSLQVKRASLNFVIGTVGSGKTTLLKGILGEIIQTSGSVQISTDDLGYCDQESWLVNGTLKENIIGQSTYDQAWYDHVLYACSLEEDIAQLSHRDVTIVGSRGITLSGGQKQRVVSGYKSFPMPYSLIESLQALARAVYSRRAILILDDVLSGLDGRTTNVIFKRLLGRKGLLRELGITIILATNASEKLTSSNKLKL